MHAASKERETILFIQDMRAYRFRQELKLVSYRYGSSTSRGGQRRASSFTWHLAGDSTKQASKSAIDSSLSIIYFEMEYPQCVYWWLPEGA
jgi:hypothetical protein